MKRSTIKSKPDGDPIDRIGTWKVYVLENTRREGSPWVTVRAISSRQVLGRRSLWLGWNGERFARGKDIDWLLYADPVVLSRLQTLMESVQK